MKKIILIIIATIFIFCGTNTSQITDNSNPKKYGIIIPAYVHYGESDFYEKLINSSSILNENLIVIINPYNGPLDDEDSINNYNKYIDLLHKNNSKIIGYVSTNYGNNSLTSVKTDIDLWVLKYNVDGIFLDETSSDNDKFSYYSELENYINSKNKNLIVNNFGTIPHTSYKSLKSIKIILETSYQEAKIEITSENYKNWINDLNTFSSNCILSYNASKDSYKSLNNYGSKWVYFTNDTLPNPWDSLPNYYTDMANEVLSQN